VQATSNVTRNDITLNRKRALGAPVFMISTPVASMLILADVIAYSPDNVAIDASSKALM